MAHKEWEPFGEVYGHVLANFLEKVGGNHLMSLTSSPCFNTLDDYAADERRDAAHTDLGVRSPLHGGLRRLSVPHGRRFNEWPSAVGLVGTAWIAGQMVAGFGVGPRTTSPTHGAVLASTTVAVELPGPQLAK